MAIYCGFVNIPKELEKKTKGEYSLRHKISSVALNGVNVCKIENCNAQFALITQVVLELTLRVILKC